MSTSRAHILAIANQKGGVGKTTTAVNLSAGLARAGKRVLLIDLDAQGSATATLCGLDATAGAVAGDDDESIARPSIAECMLGEQPLSAAIVPTSTPGLMLAPAGETLATLELHLAPMMGRERALARVLQDPIVASFDHVVIDTAPFLGLVTTNVLVACDHLIVPVSCEYLPIVGLKLFEDTLLKVRTHLGARCEVLGYLLTLVNRRERIVKEVEELLRNTFGEKVFPHPIRASTRHKSAPSHHKTIFEFDRPSGNGREDYQRLTDEVLRRLGELSRPAEGGAGFDAQGAAMQSL